MAAAPAPQQDNIERRRKLFQFLAELPGPQFDEILFSLEPPRGNIPPPQAAQSDRIAALLDWAESSLGCGLPEVETVLQAYGFSPTRIIRWLVPASRNPLFTGRERLLQQMHEALQQRQRVAINGLGGIGKTQTAIEYVYRYRDNYDAVFWVRAEPTEDLFSGYVAIAQALQLPGRDQPDRQAVVALAQHWLNTHDNWLLVVDNADDIKAVRPFLPLQSSGHILLTTRAQAIGDLAQRLEILTMAPDEGATFLLRRTRWIAENADLATASEADQPLAHELVAEMDGLPLALDQAGAYIEEQFLSLTEYLDLFRAEKAQLLSERGDLASDHPSVTITFSLAFQKVLADSPVAADLLRVCAFLAPDDIPEEIFTQGATELGEELSAIAETPSILRKAIATAAKFSLIRRHPKTQTLSIHRLVQEVLIAEMDAAEQKTWAERVVNAVAKAFPAVEFENWEECDRLLPHTLVVTARVQTNQSESETAAYLLNQTGGYLNQQGRYEAAEPLFQEALAMRQRLLGAAHPDVATSLNNLANLYYSQRRYAVAEPLLQEALAMQKWLLGPEHPHVATSLNGLAALCYFQGRYEAAELLLQEALAMQKRLLGLEHPDVATSFNNLAALYDSQGRYAVAEPLYLQTIQIWSQRLGDDHPNTQTGRRNFERCLRKAIAANQAHTLSDHPMTQAVLKNLRSQ